MRYLFLPPLLPPSCRSLSKARLPMEPEGTTFTDSAQHPKQFQTGLLGLLLVMFNFFTIAGFVSLRTT